MSKTAAQYGVAHAPSPVTTTVIHATEGERQAALQFLTGLAAEVSGGSVNLPCFPEVVLRIRRALADPNAKLSQTVKIIGTEPRLAARLLQAANSAAFNASGKPVTDLRTAITRLGHRPVQSSAMAFAVQQLRLAPALRLIAKQLQQLWEESIAVAAICETVAKRTHVNPDEAFLTGLLHGIGRLYIMVRASGKMKDLCSDPAFMEMVEGWHPAIGQAVLENWGFSDPMSQAIGDQTDYNRGGRTDAQLTDVLIVSVALGAVLRDPAGGMARLETINSFHRLNLSAEDCAGVLAHTSQQLETLHAALGC